MALKDDTIEWYAGLTRGWVTMNCPRCHESKSQNQIVCSKCHSKIT